MTEQPPKRSTGTGPFFLAAGALLVIAAVLVGVVPLADCPRCTTWNFFGPFEKWDVHELEKTCRVCQGKRNVTLIQKWTYRPGEVRR